LAPLVAFVLGVCALQAQPQLPAGILLAGSAAVAIAMGACGLLLRWPRGTAVAVTSLAALLLGFSCAGLRAHQRLADELAFADEGRDVRVTGIVDSLPVRLERGQRFEFEVESHDGTIAVPRRLLLGWYGAEIVRPGERWSLTVRLRRPHGAMNPVGVDFEAWLLERDLRATGSVRLTPPPRRLDAMVWSPATAVERSRWWLRERLATHVEGQRYGGVLLALVLGDQKAIADSDWTLFNRTGISHLVSISGLHITMIAALVGGLIAATWRRVPWLLRRIPVQSAAIGAGAIAATLYALLAGWGVPAQRTVIMLLTVACAWILRARIGLGTALALAAAIVCVFDPWAVTAAGFWMSFGAVAAIVWVVHGRPRPPGGATLGTLQAAARVQIAVTLALVPATVLMFQQVSLIAPFANAVAIPLVSWVVTPLTLLGAGCAAIPGIEALARPLLTAADTVFAGVAALLQLLAAPSWAALTLPAPPGFAVLMAAFGIAWCLAPPGWPARWLGVIALLPLLVWPGERPSAGDLWLTALDVGQGSAVVLETREQAWLYDAGPRYSQESDAGERVVLPYLRSRGIRALDGMIVSHLDQDHSGGVTSVLRGTEVRRVISSITSGHPVLGGISAERCVAGMQWSSGDLQWSILHPSASDYERRLTTNAMSCIALVHCGATTVLLTGDLPGREEQTLLVREADLHATLLMVPHHGSRSSSSAALLAAVQPAAAVAQAGYRNRFGHPHAEVLARYAERGIALTRTDHAGAAQWRFRPDGRVEFRSWRSLAGRYWHNRPGVEQRTAVEAADESVEEGDLGQPFFGMP
jgi:competence protein ComEC